MKKVPAFLYNVARLFSFIIMIVGLLGLFSQIIFILFGRAYNNGNFFEIVVIVLVSAFVSKYLNS